MPAARWSRLASVVPYENAREKHANLPSPMPRNFTLPSAMPATQTTAITPRVCAMGCVLCSSKSQFIQSFYRGSLIRVAAKNAQQLDGGLRTLTHTVARGSDLFAQRVFSASRICPAANPQPSRIAALARLRTTGLSVMITVVPGANVS